MIVTGSRSGIGFATAKRLRGAGEPVVGVDLASSDVVADLSTVEGRQGAVAGVQALCPQGVRAIIACAGVASLDGPLMVSVNYFGAVELVAALAPTLRCAPDPRVALVSSSASILATDPDLVRLCLEGDEAAARGRAKDNPLAYASTKLALSLWVRCTAVAPGWAAQGVLINAVAPGVVRTPMTEPLLATPEGRERLVQSAPHATPAPAEPEDIAEVLAFLASPENRFMVGQTIFCDGGAEVLLRPGLTGAQPND